jgi:hypothetical protein
VQPAGIDTEALDRAGDERAPERLGIHRERLKRPAQTVVIQKRRRDPQELLQRRARRPPRDVIQRRGRAQPAGAQRRRHLTRRELLAPSLRERPVDRPDQLKLFDEVPHKQQRPHLAAHSHKRWVQPREGPRELLAGRVGFSWSSCTARAPEQTFI